MNDINDTIEKLKEIGLDTIYEKTHVSIKSLEHIINKRFDAIHHIQFNGFLNIIENELHIDMTPLREALKEHRIKTGQSQDGRQLFIETPAEEKSKTPLYIILFLIIALVLFFFFTSGEEEKVTNYEDKIQSSAVEDAKQHLQIKDPTAVAEFETSAGDENAAPDIMPKEQPVKTVSAENHPFVIYPKESLWIGIINIDTDEQKDTITSEPYPLDETANLLITLGHGYLKIDLNGKIENLSDRGRVRFIYKNGKLSRISAAEFKELNKGRSW